MITNPQPLVRILTLVLLGSALVFASCSDSGNGLPTDPTGTPTDPTDPEPDEAYELVPSPESGLVPVSIDVSVELPASAGIDAAELQLLSVLQRTAPLGADGSASFTAFNDGPMLVAAVLPTGDPVLLGWVDGSRSTHTLSARSTAEVFAWFDTGSWLLLDPLQPLMVEALRSAPEVAPLEQAVAQALASAPYHLEAAGASLRPARAQVAQAILARTGAGIAGHPEIGAGIRVNPGDAQSGSWIRQEGLDRIAVVNEHRIRRIAYIDRIDPSPAEVAKIDLSPTTGVNSVGSALTNIAITAILDHNEAAYAGKTSDPVRVPMTPEDGDRTEYRVTVIGAGASAGSSAQLTSPRTAELNRLIRETLILDFVLPLLSNVAAPLIPEGTKVFSKVEAGKMPTFFDQLLNRSPDIVEKAYSGDLLGAAKLLITGILEDNSQDLILGFAEGFIEGYLGGTGASQATVEAAGKRFKDGAEKILKVLAVADATLLGVDLSMQMVDLGSSARAETFDVTITPARVNLLPLSGTVKLGEELEFRANVTEAAGGDDAFEYRWWTSGNHGVLRDAVGHEGTEFSSSRDRVVYESSGDSSGEDVIIVEVFLIDNTNRIRMGADTSTVQVADIEVTITPSSSTMWPSQTVTFRAEVDPMPEGTLYYRWTTSGNHGTTFPASGALGFAWLEYTARTNAPDGAEDWIEVEVFANLTEQNPTGPPLAIARATVKIEDRVIDGSTSIRQASSSAVWCINSLAVFPAVEGARSYELRISNHNHPIYPNPRVINVPAPTGPHNDCREPTAPAGGPSGSEGNSVVVWLAWATGDPRADSASTMAWHQGAYGGAKVEVRPRF